MRFFLSVALMFAVTAPAAASGPFDGQWSTLLDRPAPNPSQQVTINLTTRDGLVTGSLKIQDAGDARIEWGFVKGSLIVFKVMQPPSPNSPLGDKPVMFIYLGQLEGDSIAFGRRPENLALGRLREFVATRGK